MPKISVVIPARDEADTLWFTLNSLQMTRGALVDEAGMEIIVADNDPGAKTCGKTVKEVCAGFGGAKVPVRYVAAPEVKSPYYPRMVGARAAVGEQLVFLDAHVLLSPHAMEGMRRFFTMVPKLKAQTQRHDLFMIHLPVSFDRPNRLFAAYKLRLRHDFWGDWTSMNAWALPEGYKDMQPDMVSLDVRAIAASGIWCFSTSKAAWEEVGGFNSEFVGYAGGEVYLQMKYWLLGGHVQLLRMFNFQGDLGYGAHWSAPRRYQPKWAERIRNVLIGVSVVAPDLFSTVSRGLAEKSGTAPVTVARLGTEAVSAAAEEAEWMARKRLIGTTEELEEFWTRNQVFF